MRLKEQHAILAPVAALQKESRVDFYQGRSSVFLRRQTHQTPQANMPHRISSGHQQAAAGRVKRSAVNAVRHHFGNLVFSDLHFLKSPAVPRWITERGLHFIQQQNSSDVAHMLTGWNIQEVTREKSYLSRSRGTFFSCFKSYNEKLDLDLCQVWPHEDVGLQIPLRSSPLEVHHVT